jgi:predicted transcriptional regulator
MNITQETLVEYLKLQSLSLTKSSNDLERDLFLYLTHKGLMAKHNQGYASITMKGKSFLNNSYYFNPVPDTIFDWKMNIINQLKEGECMLKGDGDDFQAAKSELTQDGIIERGNAGYYNVLTTKGRLFLSSGIGYNDFLSSGRSDTTTIYNLNGGNSRVYQHSQDNSHNIINSVDVDLFANLKQLINDKVADNTYLLTLVDEMEKSKGQTTYLEKYTTFIANAANHITLISPFIPALTAFI